MTGWKTLCVAWLVVVWSTAALAQDPATADPAHYKIILDNPSVRVLQVNYAPGAKSKMHQHPDAIFVSLAAAKARFTTPDGKAQDLDLADEAAVYTPAVTHVPANIGSGPLRGLLIEFKAAAPGTATIPTSRPNMAIKVLADGPRAVAYRSTAVPTFAEPAGSHDYDQVVIALGPADLTLSVDGKETAKWARGDVQFIGRGVPHESKNNGGKPVDVIIVGIR
jgi:beta-alanine degradation protein BauB